MIYNCHYIYVKMAKVCKACDFIEECRDNLLHCSRCTSFYHYYCAGISLDNLKKMSKRALVLWKCKFCKNKQRFLKKGINKDVNSEETNKKQIECIMCSSEIEDELKLGKFMHLDNVTVHYYCLLAASKLVQKGKDDEGILGFFPVDICNEAKRGKKHKCSYCGKQGATIFCSVKKCNVAFHLPCGIQKGSIQQYFGRFRSFCHWHWRKQKVPQIYQKTKTKCLICLCEVSGKAQIDSLWSSCCKNAWFHRYCVQRLALSTGYFFKCPLCNNTEKFVKEMQRQGIYVPSRDASWELEGNAYDDLLSLYSHCDASICICPKGRSYSTLTNRTWCIILCQTCGSQGCHKGCMKNYFGNQWECPDCARVSKRAEFSSTEMKRKLEFQSEKSIVSPQSASRTAMFPTCSASSTIISPSFLNDCASSEESNGSEKANFDDNTSSQMAEYESAIDYSSEDNAHSLHCFSGVFSKIKSEEHCYSDSEGSNKESDILSFSSKYSQNITSKEENTLVNDSSNFVNKFFNKDTIKKVEEISDNCVDLHKRDSQCLSSPSVSMSLKEFLKPMNLTQTIVSIKDAGDGENVMKTFSNQAHKYEENLSLNDCNSETFVDFSVREESVLEHENYELSQHMSATCKKEKTLLDNISKKTDIQNSSSNSFHLQHEDKIITQHGANCNSSHSSENNKKLCSINLPNKFSIDRESSIEKCSFIVNLFSRFMQRPSVKSSLQTNSAQSTIKATTSIISPTIGENCFKRTNELQTTQVTKEQPNAKSTLQSFNTQLQKTFSSDFPKEMANTSDSELQSNDEVETAYNMDISEEIIEVTDQIIDIESDIEIVDLDDIDEPLVVFNVDEDVIELVD